MLVRYYYWTEKISTIFTHHQCGGLKHNHWHFGFLLLFYFFSTLLRHILYSLSYVWAFLNFVLLMTCSLPTMFPNLPIALKAMSVIGYNTLWMSRYKKAKRVRWREVENWFSFMNIRKKNILCWSLYYTSELAMLREKKL